MNHFNWSVPTLAIVLGLSGVLFNNRLSSLNDKVSVLLEENAELRTIDGRRSLTKYNHCPVNLISAPHNGQKSSRQLCNMGTSAVPAGSKCITAFKEDGTKISCKAVVDTSLEACCQVVAPEVQIKKLKMIVNKNIRNIRDILADPGIAASTVCPPDTVVTPHSGSGSSAAYCNAGTMELAAGSKCVSAFMITDGTQVKCNEVVNPNSESDTVDACCMAQSVCPAGSKKVVHYGSTSSTSYCLSGTTTVTPGSECVGAFIMPGRKRYDCNSVFDPTSRANKVEACCVEPN